MSRSTVGLHVRGTCLILMGKIYCSCSLELAWFVPCQVGRFIPALLASWLEGTRWGIVCCSLELTIPEVKKETKQKLTNNEGKQSKQAQIKCENESQYKELIVDQTRAITRAIAVLYLFVCLFCLLFLQGFCGRKRFCWRVKALGHSILVTKAKGTFVQVWARNVLQPSKLKFLLGRHMATNSFGVGRLFYKSSRQLQKFSRHGDQNACNSDGCLTL